ncbi:hypothetical protein Goari_007850 [Gossypium aridum]|uniref:Uncharacterized protein n=1 Tax=Gossypium aridum TaxID=34290 RepID=A0A7J8XS52_GOSAI|nr:hypothetical protein [Gossypium aridum]
MFCFELWIADQGYSLLALETVPMWMWLSYFTLKFGKTQYKGDSVHVSSLENSRHCFLCPYLWHGFDYDDVFHACVLISSPILFPSFVVQCCKFEESCLNRALRKTVDLLPLAMFRYEVHSCKIGIRFFGRYIAICIKLELHSSGIKLVDKKIPA